MKQIDTCGKLCPAPLILTKKAIKAAAPGEELEVTTDNLTAFKNLKDYLAELGIGFREIYDGEKQALQFVVPETLSNGVDSAESFCRKDEAGSKATDYVVVLKNDKMGSGDDTLGTLLLRAFINSLIEAEKLPTAIILYNSGVKVALKESDTAASLQALEKKGVTIIACGTCLDFFDVKSQLTVGVISNMYKITELVSRAGHVVYP